MSISVRFRRCIFLSVASLLFFHLSSTAMGQTVLFGWSPNSEPDLAGYKLYVGNQSRSYFQATNVGLATTFEVNGLQPGVSYYFALTAFNTSGLESDFTPELTYTIPQVVTNVPPALDPIADAILLEDSGAALIPLTGIKAGASNELQALAISAVSDNPALLSPLSVSYSSPATTGSLVLTPSANAFGTARVTVTVDDGQAQNNRTSRSFLVTVTAVNDRPFFAALPDINLVEGTSIYPVTITGIDAGAPNESDSLAFSATSSRPDLLPNPQITYPNPDGTALLGLRPAAGTNGTAIISVTVNDGQPQNGSFTRNFAVTISGANSPPAISAIADQAIPKNHASSPITFTVSDVETEPTDLVTSATSSNPLVLPDDGIILSGSGGTRTLTLDPVNGRLGTSMVTVTVSDGTASAAVPFSVTVENR
jgi:hypothetical protein